MHDYGAITFLLPLLDITTIGILLILRVVLFLLILLLSPIINRRRGVMIADMTFKEVRLLTDVVSRLERYTGCMTDVRQNVIEDITTLLRADFCSSYVFDSSLGKYVKGSNFNVSEESSQMYKDYYQFHDPITHKLRHAKCAIASEVMPYKELYQTEYYQAIMKNEGMIYGINLYLFDGNRDIGDFRIWRGKNSRDFESRDKKLLKVLEPYLVRSLLNTEESLRELSLLTKREKDVINLVSKGFTDKEIANYLHIGFSTVRTHLNKSMEKLNCANRAELSVKFNLINRTIN